MARGNIAKEAIVKKLAATFGSDFIGEYDRKVYVWENDGGERVQIAISLTCPKTPIIVDNNVNTDGGDWDFSDTPTTTTTVAISSAAPAEITEEEKENIAELMARLGL